MKLKLFTSLPLIVFGSSSLSKVDLREAFCSGISMLGSNRIEIKHVQRSRPDNVLKAFLQPTAPSKASMTGPIKKNPADAPAATIPIATERCFSKYVLTIRKHDINVKLSPKPYSRHNEKYKYVIPVTHDVIKSDAAQLRVPMIFDNRQPKRWHTFPLSSER